MSPKAEPKINPLLWQAIEQTRLIRLSYKGSERIVEPHDYGIHNAPSSSLPIRSAAPAATHFLPGDGWRNI